MKNIYFCQKTQIYELDIPYLNSNRQQNNATINTMDTITTTTTTNIYYNVDAIKKETKWSDVNVQSITYTPNHLSRGPYPNPNVMNDPNFYYPSTAGKGIDKCFMSKKFLDANYTEEELKEKKYFKNSCDTSILDISVVCDEGDDTNIKNYIALGEKCESVFDLENTMKNCNSELEKYKDELIKKSNIFKSKECRNKISLMNQNICKLAKMYFSEDEEKNDNDNGNDFNFSISKYELLNSKNNNICLAVKNEKLKQKYIEK
eukprot:jgi/Orpsp1_1/1175461/evm.model.c7180000053996.1